jgi:hypothetical protein
MIHAPPPSVMKNISATKKKIKTLFQVPSTILQFLYKKILLAQWFAFYYSDGSISKGPGAAMGNRTYAFRREGRIASALRMLLSGSGSCLWLTLTVPYNRTGAGRKASWLAVKTALAPFLRYLRDLGMDAYIAVKEAHAGGGCHAHIVARWDKSLPGFKRREWNPRRKVWVTRWRLGDQSLRTAIKAAWPCGHVDIQLVQDERVGAYLTKELGKASHIEDALRRARRDWDRPDEDRFRERDVKKLWAVYYATTLKIRLITTSRNLPVVGDEEEGPPPGDLINTMNNTTEAREKPYLVEMLVIPWDIKKWAFFEPYTGKVDPGSEEYRKLEALLRWERLNGLPEGATL